MAATVAACYRPRLLEDMQCDICRCLLYRPVITPCGHSFCRCCLERAYDHSQVCASCRQPLPSPVVLFTQGKHHLLAALVKLWFPRELDVRAAMALRDQPLGHFVDYRLHLRGALVPIYVCSLVFPGMPCYLHVFEPRYRLLIRRCWMGARRFGMVCSWPPLAEGERPPIDRPCYREYGTMLWIERVRFLADGRMVVLTRAERYFRVARIEPQLDGYNMASVVWAEDSDVPRPYGLLARQEREHDDINLAQAAALVYARMQRYRARLTRAQCQEMDSVYGTIPSSSVQALSYWAASVLPIDKHIRYNALMAGSVRNRLLFIMEWLDML
ncbi:PUA-like domain-containing protein [Syncephalis pseudoplumigaleata]|uniref:PUA-like domain-containing protein n=1 Tax=Syncephalis pseudoplumigaleata TaxID=1712513 RepID=A0A4V1J193_9FUNG|nr:PUA-like domain-containing protein [Syncephalis pseudoplumigaleata]|eukprot:RKP24259.1 PUA-like domain-containing protein [Syncephalis pseudoplumigaleata]